MPFMLFSKSKNIIFQVRKCCFPSQKTMFSASENKLKWYCRECLCVGVHAAEEIVHAEIGHEERCWCRRPSRKARRKWCGQLVKKTSNLGGSKLRCLRKKNLSYGKRAKISIFRNTLFMSRLQKSLAVLPQRVFWFASLHVAICVTLPRSLRHFTRSSASSYAVSDIVSRAHFLSLTAIKNIKVAFKNHDWQR